MSNNVASWGSFIKSIASYSGDLASMTAPPFILSPVSLTEYPQFWAEHPDIFVAIAEEADPEKRILLVTKWFITTLRGQYASRNEQLGSEKKPLNPFLGEIFMGKYQPAAGTPTRDIGETILVSEQVSHHPPITAYSIFNDKAGIELQGFSGFKASFSAASIGVKQVGHALVYIKEYDEHYLITLPVLHIEGILSFAPYVELEGHSFIQSTSGYSADLSYSGKGYFSGKKNSFKATISKSAIKQEGKPLYSIKGQWTGTSMVKNEATGKEELFYDSKSTPQYTFSVKPLEEQHEYESRKAWLKVSEAIKLGDYDLISKEKSKIENAQRDLRKAEEAGKPWQSRFFVACDPRVNNGDKYVELSTSLGNKPNSCTNGAPSQQNWRFVREKYDKGEIKA
ncbi:Oxysterol-binding protein [Nadsonia fulvescens var. elongata DSM 6958]|uniref:Oxysterol-binding protein n=1 Tax=Nadsonia fulvescens var. elongata DSM 6958 TaxID=857566 RepID=A0A1E3PTA3_9ASCO|nr:Oxysterol-binding protein [Nadsonia fulvescens var. elongata DSM 6958]